MDSWIKFESSTLRTWAVIIQRPGVAEYEASVGSSEEGVQRSHTESIEFRGVKYLMHIATSTALAQLCSTKHIPRRTTHTLGPLCDEDEHANIDLRRAEPQGSRAIINGVASAQNAAAIIAGT